MSDFCYGGSSIAHDVIFICLDLNICTQQTCQAAQRLLGSTANAWLKKQAETLSEKDLGRARWLEHGLLFLFSVLGFDLFC